MSPERHRAEKVLTRWAAMLVAMMQETSIVAPPPAVLAPPPIDAVVGSVFDFAHGLRHETHFILTRLAGWPAALGRLSTVLVRGAAGRADRAVARGLDRAQAHVVGIFT